MEIAVGDAGLSEFVVKKEDTALLQGSGELPVFSTPCMIALMESAAVDALRGRLAPGETSVGIGVDVRHLAASPVGVSVRAVARVVEVNGLPLRLKPVTGSTSAGADDTTVTS